MSSFPPIGMLTFLLCSDSYITCSTCPSAYMEGTLEYWTLEAQPFPLRVVMQQERQKSSTHVGTRLKIISQHTTGLTDFWEL